MEHPFNHPLLSIWLGVISRCHVPSNPAFEHYGGRGITVSPEWMNFQTFVRDIGDRPSLRHSIERRDVNAGYGPTNCYWATATEQNRNTRRTRWLTYKGDRRSLPEWAEISGVPAATLTGRLRRGWNLELALTTPSDRPIGEGRIRERQTDRLCAAAGISRATFYSRVKAGMSESEALSTPPNAKRLPEGITPVVSLGTYYARLRWGWTKEEAALTPFRQKPPRLAGAKKRKPSGPNRAHRITFQGKTLSVTEWARRVNIHPSTLFARIRAGTPIEVALTTEPCYGQRIGRVTLAQRLQRAGLTFSAYYTRLKKGWTKEAAMTTPPDRRYQHRSESQKSD